MSIHHLSLLFFLGFLTFANPLPNQPGCLGFERTPFSVLQQDELLSSQLLHSSPSVTTVSVLTYSRDWLHCWTVTVKHLVLKVSNSWVLSGVERVKRESLHLQDNQKKKNIGQFISQRPCIFCKTKSYFFKNCKESCRGIAMNITKNQFIYLKSLKMHHLF